VAKDHGFAEIVPAADEFVPHPEAAAFALAAEMQTRLQTGMNADAMLIFPQHEQVAEKGQMLRRQHRPQRSRVCVRRKAIAGKRRFAACM